MFQVLVLSLQPGQEVLCEPGAMLHAHDGIEADAETGGCYDACRRAIIGGQDFFRDRYVNNTNEVKSITLTSRYPGGKLIPIELDGLYQTSTGGMVMKRGAWTASIGRGVDFGVRLAKNLTGGCCAGQGPIFATIGGSGTAFLNGGGTVLEARLRDGERIVLDTDALVACDATVDIGARRAGTAAAMCCGGEGLFVAELTGPGRVIVQSMPIEKAAAQYAKFIKAPAGATAPARPRRRAPPDTAAESKETVPPPTPRTSEGVAQNARTDMAVPLVLGSIWPRSVA